ncbi:MAG: hypothetical protein CM1200mP35_04010 [Chloroflexota bacterium]|nr:MAG: hypothetical protein CM1200mP35_04010 [Chloroflexota bacterium]
MVSFEEGTRVETGRRKTLRVINPAGEINGLPGAVSKLTTHIHPEAVASAIEFVLEGLHLRGG